MSKICRTASIRSKAALGVLLLGAMLFELPVQAQAKPDCSGLPDAARLKSGLQWVVREGAAKNGGLGNQEWAAVVNRDGVVCAIVFSGTNSCGSVAGKPRHCCLQSQYCQWTERARLRAFYGQHFCRLATRTEPL